MPEVDDDMSANTARFRAFVQRQDDLPEPWRMRAPGSKVGLLAAIVIAVAVLVAIVMSVVAG
jgi:hypothetical protein